MKSDYGKTPFGNGICLDTCQCKKCRKEKGIELDIGTAIKGTHHDKPSRGDYRLCRECDKPLKDYINYKDPRDREKIKQEYFGIQEEYRRNKVMK